MLQNLVDRSFSEECEGVEGLVVGFDRTADSLTIRIRLFDYSSGSPELWQIRCSEYREFIIRPEPGEIAVFNATHAAVRQYVDPNVELFFTGATADPGRVAERLRAAHDRVAGDWIPPERYLNSIPPADLLGRAGGRLFSGPLFIGREFERVLREAGMTINRLPEEIFERPLSESSLELLIIGRSHIVAPDLEAQRL
jgi:hypothetical protein